MTFLFALFIALHGHHGHHQHHVGPCANLTAYQCALINPPPQQLPPGFHLPPPTLPR